MRELDGHVAGHDLRQTGHLSNFVVVLSKVGHAAFGLDYDVGVATDLGRVLRIGQELLIDVFFAARVGQGSITKPVGPVFIDKSGLLVGVLVALWLRGKQIFCL